MNVATSQGLKTFNLLSIGQRGVGKTVFLAGSYAELNNSEFKNRQLWFECQDSQVQENIERILNYVVQTQEYPPPTIKVTSFGFSLKRRNWQGTQTLCHFHWRDLPGEICQSHNPEFRQLVSSSHGCCVFIDAQALVKNPAYLPALTEIIEQVTAIASLVYLNGLKYAFAIVLTKSDLIENIGDRQQQIEQQLQPLTQSLESTRATYQIFYSCIPLVKVAGVPTLLAKGAEVPLTWLAGELYNAHQSRAKLPELFPRQQAASPPTLKRLFDSSSKASTIRQLLGIYLYPSRFKSTGLALLAIAVLAGITSSAFIDYKQLLWHQTNSISDGQQPQQINNDIALFEKLVQQQPQNINLKLQLAQLYELTGEITKAETAYDRVLAQEKDNITALSRKAILLHAQGATKQSAALFSQAESAAPEEMKAKIRDLAQTTLQPSVNINE